MPFPDEVQTVEVVAYLDSWPAEYRSLAETLSAALGPTAEAIDHVGSTSVPGLAAKDIIDVQVQIAWSDAGAVAERLAAIGLRQRPEPWNVSEESSEGASPKMVFAPPVGGRPVNVHIRPIGSAAARAALLFRDYLITNEADRQSWSSFKRRLAEDVRDLGSYGQLKAHPWAILMRVAERWAANTGWRPDAVSQR